jgi:tRNA-2-methylthio-N6-dimethylallyladenosine synthase
LAGRKMEDDVPGRKPKPDVCKNVDLQLRLATKEEFIGKTVEVLIEKLSKKSKEEFSGRNSQSITVVFPKEDYKIGDFVNENSKLYQWNLKSSLLGILT